MSAEGRKDMIGKITKWENELWSYVSSGDGTCCPIYSRCQVRRRGSSCFDDNKTLIERFSSIRRSNPDNFSTILANDADFTNIMDHWTPGEIFRLVEKLAQKCLKKEGISSPPVPANIIKLTDGDNPVEVRLLPLKNYHGAIWRLSDRWVIQLNAKDAPAIRRFTLFHEAFHILAHCQATPVFNSPRHNGAYFNELLADYFAVCMHMPREWVVEKWREVNNIGRMAEIFGTLESQVWIRLKQLHLI